MPSFKLTKQEFDTTKLIHAAAYSFAKVKATMQRHTASSRDKDLEIAKRN